MFVNKRLFARRNGVKEAARLAGQRFFLLAVAFIGGATAYSRGSFKICRHINADRKKAPHLDRCKNLLRAENKQKNLAYIRLKKTLSAQTLQKYFVQPAILPRIACKCRRHAAHRSNEAATHGIHVCSRFVARRAAPRASFGFIRRRVAANYGFAAVAFEGSRETDEKRRDEKNAHFLLLQKCASV